MGFRDKLTKKATTNSFSQGSSKEGGDKPREFYPKSIGIHCIDNPKIERRNIRPHVIGIPPSHRTSNIEFKGSSFPATSYWLGKLFAEPIVIELGYFPSDALYVGTDDMIFPNSSNNFKKKLPLLEKEIGIKVPTQYDLVVPVGSERKRLILDLSKATTDKSKAYRQAKLDELEKEVEGKSDEEFTRTTYSTDIIPRIFIPVLTTVVREEEDAEGELIQHFDPTLAIFEETLGSKKANALFNAKVLGTKYDTAGMTEYLYDNLDDAVGEPIMLFRNIFGSEGNNTLAPICAKKYEDKIPKTLLPYFEINSAPNIDSKTLLRIIVLDMIQLFTKAGDKSNLEGQIKEFFWDQIRAEGESK